MSTLFSFCAARRAVAGAFAAGVLVLLTAGTAAAQSTRTHVQFSIAPIRVMSLGQLGAVPAGTMASGSLDTGFGAEAGLLGAVAKVPVGVQVRWSGHGLRDVSGAEDVRGRASMLRLVMVARQSLDEAGRFTVDAGGGVLYRQSRMPVVSGDAVFGGATTLGHLRTTEVAPMLTAGLAMRLTHLGAFSLSVRGGVEAGLAQSGRTLMVPLSLVVTR